MLTLACLLKQGPRNLLHQAACRPIVWLRYFSLVFYQVLAVASLTLFLMTMDCQYFSVEKSVQGYNQQFPDVCKY